MHILLGLGIVLAFAFVTLAVLGLCAVAVAAQEENRPDEFAHQRTPGMGEIDADDWDWACEAVAHGNAYYIDLAMWELELSEGSDR